MSPSTRRRPTGWTRSPTTNTGLELRDAGLSLRDSHILADLPSFADGVEAGEASGHCDGSGRLVADIAVPAAQPADHPGQARERALGVRVLELDGLAFELPGEDFDQGLSGLVHGVGELL